jgi:hypothetical protein
MPLVRGTQLGPYKVEAPLAKSGMGEVYLAKDISIAVLIQTDTDLSSL